jgi:hypothetical protein
MKVWVMSVLLGVGAAAGMDDKVRLAVTQRDLVPECLNGSSVERGRRDWTIVPGQVSLVLSMRSQARPGRPQPDSGRASISFTAEAGHRYEVEVRAEPEAFSSRAWRAGEWTPVVRNRTTDRLVSSEPQWAAGSCGAWHN